MSAVKFLPIIVAVVLAGSMVGYAYTTLPTASTGQNVTLRIGYPDSLDMSDVTDMYAYQLLAQQGIHVIPTFYDAPPLSYKGLLSGQQDISFGTSAQSFARGPGLQHTQTTCVTAYALAGVFLSIAGDGITQPSQMLGKSTEDFGPGTSTRTLNLYWYSQAKIPTNTNGVNASSVYLITGGGNIARVNDIENGKTQAIVVDDFILSTFTDPSINNTAHHGPFHVLFYAPNNIFDNCFAVSDSWLSNSANQKVIVSFIAAIIQAQRHFISDPGALVTFGASQLPLTPTSQIQFTSTFYPGAYTYWPYGAYNLLGNEDVKTKFDNTNTYFMNAGIINTPDDNASVTPYGVINKWFEYQALQQLGPYQYPHQSWVTPAFTAQVQATVPAQFGGVSGAATTS